MDRIEIHHFGPIVKAEIEVKKFTVFIGATSSGKSTAAKLIAIMKSVYMERQLTFGMFWQMLEQYNINFTFRPETQIIYTSGEAKISVRHENVEMSQHVREVFQPIYIPAERNVFSQVSQSIFSLTARDISLSKMLLNYGAQLEKARRNVKQVKVGFLDVQYEIDGQDEVIRLKDNTTIPFSQASSGLQSAIPMLLIVMDKIRSEDSLTEEPDLLVVEEPELNLYPSTQKALIELIVGRVNQSRDYMLITTHSPYLLTSLDNLIQADTVARLHPNRSDLVATLVPRKLWLEFRNISCYFFENGTCRSTLDEKMLSIGPSNIDDVSSDISETFEQLLELKYPS